MKKAGILFSLSLIAMLSACKGDQSAPPVGETPPVTTPDTPATPPVTTTTETPSGKATGLALNSEEGGFSVTLPSGYPNPTKDVQPIQTDAGTFNMTSYMAETPTGLVMLAFNDYNDEVFKTRDVNTMIDGARDGALKSMKGMLESQKDYTFNGHPARSIFFNLTLETGEKAYGRLDYIVAKPRLYQVGFLAMKQEDLNNLEVKGYFESFKLVK